MFSYRSYMTQNLGYYLHFAPQPQTSDGLASYHNMHFYINICSGTKQVVPFFYLLTDEK
jgi:hypothetical protein